MRAPSAQVGRYRRCAYLYTPLLLLGALCCTAGASLNGLWLAGTVFVLAAAAIAIAAEARPAR